MDTLFELEISLIIHLQEGLGWLFVPMQAVSLLGDPLFYLFVIPAIYWCYDARLGLRLGLLLGASCGINNAMKVAFHTPRPYLVSQKVKALSSNTTFALPSGHAQTSVTFLGPVASWLKRPSIWAASLLIIFFVGFSRVFLGVHFIRDVLAGWIVGAIILLGFLALDRRWSARMTSQTTLMQVLLTFLASLTLLVFNALVYWNVGTWEVPAIWLQNAHAAAASFDPFNPDTALFCCGSLFGLGTGAALMHRQGGFHTGGIGFVRFARYPVGMVGVILIWYIFGILIPHEYIIVDFGLRYLRAALWGAWISFGAPLLMLRLNLLDAGS